MSHIFYTKAQSLQNDAFKDGDFSGYAAKTGNIDKGGDVILKGAFSDPMDAKKIRVLWQHNWHEPIGIVKAIGEDDYGLKVDGELIMDVARAKEARALTVAGAIDGLSIGFFAESKDIAYENDIRIIKKLTVIEFSFVTLAMNPDAIVTDMKSANIESIRDVENYLRDVCKLSRSEAKTLISKIKAIRDAEPNYDELAASLVKFNQTLRG